MRTLLIFILSLFATVSAKAQTISTVAGNGLMTNTGDGGPASASSVYIPGGGVFDKAGNYYFPLGGGNVVRKISVSGIISTIAGNGLPGYNGDGIAATAARMRLPVCIALDSLEHIYICDQYDHRIRRVDKVTGIITTVAGNGLMGYGGDGGPATAAMLNGQRSICFDPKGNLYIADATNNRVRKVDTAGIITTVMGNGIPGYSDYIYNGGKADTSRILDPWGVCSDDTGNIYICNIIWLFRLDTAGYLHVIGGTGIPGYSGDGGPATAAQIGTQTIARDRYGNLFLTEGRGQRIRKIGRTGIITTVVGNGIEGYNGDGIPSLTAHLNRPYGITTDSCGNLYFGDPYNYRLRKVTFPYCGYEEAVTDVAAAGISIYPNPTNHLLHIDNLQTNAGYRILSIVGAAIQQGQLRAGNNELNIRDLPPGMYLLEVTEDGKKTIQKLVKQ